MHKIHKGLAIGRRDGTRECFEKRHRILPLGHAASIRLQDVPSRQTPVRVADLDFGQAIGAPARSSLSA
jgi:hypothetical protein